VTHPRRTFLSPAEVPQRIAGALRGDPASVRRILGARRAGRFGALLLAVGGLAAFPLGYVLLGFGLHGAAVTAFSRWPHSVSGLRLTERLRLAGWTTGPVLLAFALLRLIWPESLVPGLAGLALGHALLVRALGKGLRPIAGWSRPDPRSEARS
jgi:hypothetical protein